MSAVVHKTVLATDGEQLSLYTVTPQHESVGACGVVIMHGAGTGDKERHLPFAEDFAAYGHPAVALDFSGHGESTGELLNLSLRRRRDQAAAVVDEVFGAERRLVLVGFSMSGQTVADLVDLYGKRVAAIVLCAPGIYGKDTWDVPFGAGFTELIRRPESWRDSQALDTYASFDGRALLVLPEHDAVIPDGVTELLRTALSTRADFSSLRLAGAGHRLGAWLADQSQARSDIISTLLRRRPSVQTTGTGPRSAGLPADADVPSS
ncbi:alpha/beta hydrolase [Streptomyces albidus (ex Kaewkla and Franco 2022)]|uniref:alpha/beta hydrolase n=1 Tax=Streptomyces albidus (ex Kaewkla and Franco 2022) TaxID=722709 RepID=UPI0015EECCAE|nr:alpha/beta fold hydrolase [Streptomyces albidus (ex Kaewkla and Franco 2022)]